MTVQECAIRERQIVERIRVSMIADPHLAPYVGLLTVEIGGDGVIISGIVRDQDALTQIIPSIRRAGVLAKVQNRVVSE